ncbi:MAG TPA: hypothetical protein VMZ53_03480 [Kofleriaceae bacterium]|nr:hypothetical protein [Kofleriaceae bacterium]
MERKALAAAIVVASMAQLAHADDKVDVKVTDSVVGDGRSFAPVTVTGGPKVQGKALPVPDVATVTCANAAGLAAPPNGLPAVLAPVATAATTLECKAQSRGAETSFKLKVTPPPAGLYAGVAAMAKSTDAKIEVPVISWDGKKASAPGALKASASDGTVDVAGAALTLSVSGKVPRLVAIAMLDGTRAGAAFVPVIGVTTLPVESDTNSNVEVWIAGTWFGPVPTKGKTAEVPIEVPPGITHAVARSTSQRGYVTDAVTDLKIPVRLRIGAVAGSTKLAAGEKTLIAIAVAGADGRPAAASAKVVATASKGALGAIQSKGGGLWTVEFTAPTTPGNERVSIRVEGDPNAGTGEVPVEIGGGAASKLELGQPTSPVVPGGELVVPIHMTDASGNVLDGSTATATLGGTNVQITDGAVHGKIPEVLPPSGTLKLVVDAGGVQQSLDLKPSSPAVSATVSIDVDGRDAELVIVVRDKFGNLVQDGTFDLAVTGGAVRGVTRTERGFRARVAAAEHAADADIVVRAGGQSLAQTSVHFDPPSHAFVVGAWAAGGWMDNLGALKSPRAALGLGLRRGGTVELGLSAGVEGIMTSESTTVDVMGMPDKTDRSIQGLGVPVLARAHVRITRRLGVTLAGGVVPMRVKVELTPTLQPADRDAATVIGFRGQLTADVRLGPGRAFAGASYGRAKLEAANAVGQLDGLGLVAGYEWWFGAFGW